MDTFGVDASTLTVKQIEAELKIHRETLMSGRAGEHGNIHVRIGDLERELASRADRIEPRKWAKFHLYIPPEHASDGDILALNNLVRDVWKAKLNYVEDIECPEYVLDEE